MNEGGCAGRVRCLRLGRTLFERVAAPVQKQRFVAGVMVQDGKYSSNIRYTGDSQNAMLLKIHALLGILEQNYRVR